MTPLERYVADLSASLHGPRRLKRDLVTEARDHLTDATESLEASGLTRHEAEAQATDTFGPVEQLAPAYQAVLASSHARRTSMILFMVTVAQPAAWGIIAPNADAASTALLPRILNGLVEGVGSLTMACALAVAILCGIAVRRVGIRPSLVRAGCLANLVLSATTCLIATGLFATGSNPSWVSAAYVTVLAVVPFGLVAQDSARCLRGLRAARRETDRAVA